MDRLSMIRAHAENTLERYPEDVPSLDRLWLIGEIDRLRLEIRGLSRPAEWREALALLREWRDNYCRVRHMPEDWRRRMEALIGTPTAEQDPHGLWR